MKSRIVRYFLWWGLILLTMLFTWGIWATPVGERWPPEMPIYLSDALKTQIHDWLSPLPTYTAAELEAIRGSPLDPNDPMTLYLPPGIDTLEGLPPCVSSTVDDPNMAIDEDQLENERRMRDGTLQRSVQARIVVCRYIPDPSRGISMTVEEYDRWWAEQHGTPAAPALAQPTSPIDNNP